jgi:RNA polymerase sigma-70 factor (ECF subfamily)
MSALVAIVTRPVAPDCEAVRDGDRIATSAGRTMTATDDAALVRRAQAGDRLAFEELVRRYADRLNAVVLRLVDDRHEAQEVTQEAFLRAWRGIGGFKGEAQFFTWLYRIGVNEARRRAQRRPAGRRTLPLDDQHAEPQDSGPGPQRSLEQRDLRAALERAVRGLAPEYRAPLILRDVEGLSTAEAAAIMGLEQAAFKSRLHRARLTVRAAVDSYLPDEDGI